MRKSRFTEAQIIGMINEQEAGMPTAEACRKRGLNGPEFVAQAVQGWIKAVGAPQRSIHGIRAKTAMGRRRPT